jgi:redox-sensitive bicupin YhaK (pirin superfamily)
MSILKTVTPVTHDLGSFQVRRAVPSPECRMVGPFVFVDQFGPARLGAGEGMDVRPHPHINLATVTWLSEGGIDHRDRIERRRWLRRWRLWRRRCAQRSRQPRQLPVRGRLPHSG